MSLNAVIHIRMHFESDIFKNSKLVGSNAFVLNSRGNGSVLQAVELVGHSGSGISFDAPGTSLTMLTFEKE